MSAIHTKSLTGITSITTPPGVDNVFTVHSNDTTERFRVDLNGNQSIAGILTVSQDLDVDGHTNLDNLSVAGVSTFSNKIQVGSGVTIESNQVATGQATFTGIVTASSFRGDGSQLTGVTSVGGNTGVDFNDNVKVRLGTGNDLEIYYDGTDGWIKNVGKLKIESTNDQIEVRGDIIYLRNRAANQNYFYAANNAFVGLTYAGDMRLETESTGIKFRKRLDPETDSAVDLGTNAKRWRNIYADTYYGDGSNLTGITGTTINNNADNRVITGSGTANTLEGEANLTFTGSQLNITGNISLPDSTAPDYVGNIYVGSSSDLKIFHNGYDNFIRSGAGNHNIRIDNNAGVLGARFIPAGSSELYHNGGLRAYTVSNGFYAEQAEHNDDFDLLIANKFGSLNNNQRCAITCRVTKDAGGSHGGTNRQAVFGHMYNGSTGGGGYFNIRSNDGTNRDFYMDNNTNLRVNYGSNNIGSTNGTVVGSQGSDIRNKNLVGDGSVPYGLSEVLQLNPIRYQFKKELVNRIGFSAQQVEPIIPESVYDTGQDQDYEGNTVSGDTIKAMYYVDLIPVLVNAIKELKAENDALKKRLDDGGL